MFDRLARLATRRPKIIVAAALVFIGLTFVYGSSASNYLSQGGQSEASFASAQAICG